MDNINTFCLKEIKSFDNLKIGDNLYLSLNGGEFKEYKIIKIQQNKPIETDPEMPITISYTKNKKVDNKPFYSRFSKHYSHK